MTSRPASPIDLSIEESVVEIGPPGAELIGVLARPVAAAQTKTVGVVIVVGGPQTRVGSHRQFVVMARALARAGHACLRFDYTGMGDSPGPKPDFEKAGPDIGRACDALLVEVSDCDRIVLWGLCDGATAALFYAQNDARVAAVIAANPWGRSEATRAAAIVSEHYGSRLRSAEFWKKLFTGKVDLLATGREAIGNLLKARAPRGMPAGGAVAGLDLPARLARALTGQRGGVRLQLSGKDLTAAEFEIAMTATGIGVPGPATLFRLEQADHTFSNPSKWQSIIDDTLAQVRGA